MICVKLYIDQIDFCSNIFVIRYILHKSPRGLPIRLVSSLFQIHPVVAEFGTIPVDDETRRKKEIGSEKNVVSRKKNLGSIFFLSFTFLVESGWVGS